MNEFASVTGTMCLADTTGRAIVGLIFESAGVARDAAPSISFVQRLAELSQSDACFRQWIGAVTCDEQCLGKEEPLRQLAQRFPEAIVRNHPPLRCADDNTTRDLTSAAHLATRLRAVESNVSAELHSRQNESLYNFAYGLSHELNNPLAIIATRAGVLARDETNRQRRFLLDSIIENAMRGSEMLGDLMLVARPPTLAPKDVSSDDFFGEILKQSQDWARPFSVTIVDEIDAPKTLCIDRSAMTEALWCLIRNAIEALPSGGEITFRATLATPPVLDQHGASESLPDQVRGAQPREAASQQWLKIAIEDDGVPLSRLALEHCFDPFYSGREAGRGLGLGLTKSQRIVTLHGGILRIENRPCSGCVATIEIPC